MRTLAGLSSMTALVAVPVLSVTLRRTLTRIKQLDTQHKQVLDRAEAQRQVTNAFTAVLIAARASLSPCPACDNGKDESCVCETRRRALADSVTAVEALAGPPPMGSIEQTSES